jgi:hypothetical protein
MKAFHTESLLPKAYELSVATRADVQTTKGLG